MSKAAKVAYTPVGVVGGLVAGIVAKKVFNGVWAKARGDAQAPNARTRDAGLGEILLASAIQGAISLAVRNGVDRVGAVAFSKWAGAWPGDEAPPPVSRPRPAGPGPAD